MRYLRTTSGKLWKDTLWRLHSATAVISEAFRAALFDKLRRNARYCFRLSTRFFLEASSFCSMIAHACVATVLGCVGAGLYSACKSTADNVAAQEVASHSALGPALLLLSFLLVDQAIRWFESEESCNLVGDATTELVTIVMFSTMFVTTLTNAALTGAEKQLSLFFSLFVHSMIVITYMQMFHGTGSGRVVWSTWYGSFFWPSRINLWTHSSMSQILCFAASPRAVERFGVSFVLYRVLDVLLMFTLGFFATINPPAFFVGHARLVFTLITLIPASFFLFRVVSFMIHALPMCLYLPETSNATDTQRCAPSIKPCRLGWP